MSRDGLVVDELGAVPSVNERINVKVTVEDRFSEVCDSNINGAVSADEIGRQKTFDEGRS